MAATAAGLLLALGMAGALVISCVRPQAAEALRVAIRERYALHLARHGATKLASSSEMGVFRGGEGRGRGGRSMQGGAIGDDDDEEEEEAMDHDIGQGTLANRAGTRSWDARSAGISAFALDD